MLLFITCNSLIIKSVFLETDLILSISSFVFFSNWFNLESNKLVNNLEIISTGNLFLFSPIQDIYQLIKNINNYLTFKINIK